MYYLESIQRKKERKTVLINLIMWRGPSVVYSKFSTKYVSCKLIRNW
jgi:hypothetical protein